MDQALADRVRMLYEKAWSDGQSWDSALGDAVRLLRDHLAIEPDCVEALTSLGAILSDHGEHREAAEILKRAVDLGSSDGNTYYNLAAAMANIDANGRSGAPRWFAKANRFEPKPTTLKAYFDPHGH